MSELTHVFVVADVLDKTVAFVNAMAEHEVTYRGATVERVCARCHHPCSEIFIAPQHTETCPTRLAKVISELWKNQKDLKTHAEVLRSRYQAVQNMSGDWEPDWWREGVPIWTESGGLLIGELVTEAWERIFKCSPSDEEVLHRFEGDRKTYRWYKSGRMALINAIGPSQIRTRGESGKG